MKKQGHHKGPFSVLLPRPSLTVIMNVFLYVYVLGFIFEEFLNIGIGDLMCYLRGR